jgi:probable HAF family extracellular repeat protein
VRTVILVALLSIAFPAGAAGAAGALAPVAYTAMRLPLGVRPGPAINASGDVVGSAPTASGDAHAFLYSHGTLTDLGTLGGTSSIAHGVNAGGQVVGESTTAAGDTHAFLYRDGAMTDLGTLGGAGSVAYALNASGTIVGLATTAAGDQHGFVYRNGAMTDLDFAGCAYFGVCTVPTAINASGSMATSYSGYGDSFRVYYNQQYFFCSRHYVGFAINDAGTVVGWSYDRCPLDVPGIAPESDVSHSYGINDGNLVVGEFTGPAGRHAWVSSPFFGWLDLNTVLNPGVLAADEDLESAIAVNDSGTILARSNFGDSYVLTPSNPAVTLAPASLDFGNQLINTSSAPQSATVTNTGAFALTVQGVAASAGFTQTNDCGTTLAAGGSCTITVTFTPAQGGASAGTVTFTANGIPTPIELGGTGTIEVTLAASAATATTGTAVTLSWTATSGTTCAAAGGAPGDGWSGPRLSTGSATVRELSAGIHRYSLTCTSGTASLQAVATVTYLAPQSGIGAFDAGWFAVGLAVLAMRMGARRRERALPCDSAARRGATNGAARVAQDRNRPVMALRTAWAGAGAQLPRGHGLTRGCCGSANGECPHPGSRAWARCGSRS